MAATAGLSFQHFIMEKYAVAPLAGGAKLRLAADCATDFSVVEKLTPHPVCSPAGSSAARFGWCARSWMVAWACRVASADEWMHFIRPHTGKKECEVCEAAVGEFNRSVDDLLADEHTCGAFSADPDLPPDVNGDSDCGAVPAERGGDDIDGVIGWLLRQGAVAAGPLMPRHATVQALRLPRSSAFACSRHARGMLPCIDAAPATT
ncbi:hypothetical protein CYMTET_11726 [Cymbomonas tetramitiformis]|uniref:Uncharacterized protein n=1 Tax=Cymbomonas tetramitiformis TaxID=36881 RepID=A0AAE0LCR4_9CHLO|nr:hypothetical protein CYMTET_11726 [Cymbomonas tetramitiformis]